MLLNEKNEIRNGDLIIGIFKYFNLDSYGEIDIEFVNDGYNNYHAMFNNIKINK